MEPDRDERRALRRDEARRRVVRQRRLAAGGLVAVVAALAVVTALALGGGDDLQSTFDLETAAATDTVAETAPSDAAGAPAGPAAGLAARAPEPPPGQSERPGQPIPILMYHATEAPPAGSPYPELWVAPDRFAEQLQALEDAGYTAITMRDAEDYWAGRRRVPAKPIVLTFDDGYRSHVDHALPELERRGWPGVLYLEVAALQKEGAEGIPEAQVRQLLDAGWELGAHTVTHPDLTTLDASGRTEEIAGSRRALRRRFGVPVTAFCYPAGRFDDTVIAAVEEAGFKSATTVEPGLAGPGDTPFTRHRVRVNGSHSGAEVVAAIRAAGG